MNPFRGLNFDSKIRQNGACSGAMYTTSESGSRISRMGRDEISVLEPRSRSERLQGMLTNRQENNQEETENRYSEDMCNITHATVFASSACSRTSTGKQRAGTPHICSHHGVHGLQVCDYPSLCRGPQIGRGTGGFAAGQGPPLQDQRRLGTSRK